MLNREQIEKILPHRGEALLIHQCEEPDLEQLTIASQVTIPRHAGFLDGHFPGNPIVPGFVLIEAIAQLGGIVVMSLDGYQGKIAMIAGIEKARFRRPVRPGDQAKFEVQVEKLRRNAGAGRGKVTVDGQLCCEAAITFFIS